MTETDATLAKATPLRWKRARGGLTVLLVMTAATALVFWFYLRAPLSNTLLGCGDHWLYFGPHHFAMDHAIQNGELPMWNPLILCGTPYAANPQTLLFYPPNLLRSVLTFHPTPLNTHIGMGLLVFLHVLMAGMGTYGFARAHGLSRGASYVAAFVFMFSAPFTGRAMVHWMFVAMAAWLPLVLWLLRLALTDPQRRWRYAVAAGVIFGISMLAGFPQLTLYMAIAVTGYGLLFRLTHLPKAQRLADWGVLGMKDAALYFIVFAVALLIAAAMLWPAAEFAKYSSRSKDAEKTMAAGEYAKFDYLPETWRSTAQHWSSYGVPERVTRHALRVREILRNMALYSGAVVRPNGQQEFDSLKLAGAGALLLALAALMHRARRDIAVYAALFYVLVDCAIGPPFPISRVVWWLAPFRLGISERACIVACFPLAMLAAYGADAAIERWANTRRHFAWAVLYAVVAIGILIPLYVATSPHPVLPDLSPMVVVAPAALAACLMAAGWFGRARLWQFVLPAILLIELAAWNQSYLREIYEQWPYRGSMESFREDKEISLANSRSSFNHSRMNPNDPEPASMNWLMYDLQLVTNGYDPLHIAPVKELLSIHRRTDAFDRTFYPFELTFEQPRGALFLKRSFWLARQWAPGALPEAQTLFPVATTAFLAEDSVTNVQSVARESLPTSSVSADVTRTNVPLPPALAQPLTATGSPHTVILPPFERGSAHAALLIHYECDTRGALDIVFRDTRSGRQEPGRQTALAPTAGAVRTIELPLPDFDTIEAKLTAHFHTGSGSLSILQIELLSDNADENDLVEIVSRTMNTVTVRVGPLPEPRLLLFVDAHYPGWRAWVNGEPRPILLADNAFKAVELPAGTHDLRFAFRPPRVVWGMAVSAATALFAAVYLLWPRRRPAVR